MPCREIAYAGPQDREVLRAWLRRRENPGGSVDALVQEILDTVRERGDAALVEYTRRFDCPDFTPDMLRLPPDVIANASSQVPAADLAILHLKPRSPEQRARQVRSLRMASSQCQVIVVADHPTLEMAQALMREGARGLLAAPFEGPTLRDAISGLCEAGLRGDSASAPLPVPDQEEVFAARHDLTARQTEVLNHLLQGQAG